MRRRIVAIALAVGLTATAGACSSSPSTSADGGQAEGGGGDAAVPTKPQAGGSLVFGTQGETTGWMPMTDRWGPGPITVAKTFFDPMVTWGTDGEVKPFLVKAFEPSEDFTQWDILLRPDLTFHNGEKVDAHSIVYNLQKYRTSALTTFAFQPVVDIQKVEGDDLRVRVTLDQSWASFPAALTGQAGFVVAPEQLNAEPAQASMRPIGSGPFEFTSWEPDKDLVANRYDDYWMSDADGNRYPYLDEVTFVPTPDEASRMQALQSGDLDVVQTNSPGTVAAYLAESGDTPEDINVLEDNSESDELNVTLNTQSGPLADERLRKALQLVTDRQALVDNFDGVFPIADGPMSESSQWWSDAGWPEPNLEEAKALVAEYQADNPGPIALNLMVLASPDGLQFGQLVEQQWSQLGIDVEIQSVEETQFSNRMLGGDFDALVTQFWNGADPDANYHFWTGDNIGSEGSITLNFPRWSNDEVDAALNKAREAGTEQERKDAYATVWQQWAEHVPYLWIYHAKWLILYRDRVHGLSDLRTPEGAEIEPVQWGSVFLTATWVTGG